MKEGLVHIYTGNGKGKTSAAIGLGIRACGRGLRVLMVQFLKSIETGEMFTIKKLEPDFMLYRDTPINRFIWEMNSEELEIVRKSQNKIFSYAEKSVEDGLCDLVILDEIIAAVNTNLLEKTRVINFIKNKPKDMELVLTGRDAPLEFIELSDYVSEIGSVKHPMDKGIKGRKGIEF